MIKKVNLNYRIWEWLSRNPNKKQGEIVAQFAINQTTIASALLKMMRRGSIERSGEKWQYTYAATDIAPQKYGRVKPDYRTECGQMVFVESSAGNTIFDECRQNWSGYQINKMLEGVRL
ncbi:MULTISPECIES: hypothetical protein [unclassified Cedecea]|uniref:hypothetical protein n=1 Tax=unclassified Cedecea TaxID=2649846 RepID=UPI003017F58A